MDGIKLFNRWDSEGVVVSDPGLQKYIGLESTVVPASYGRNAAQQFHKSKAHIVERLALKLMVPGHKSKRHFKTSGRCTGKLDTELAIIEEVFEKLEKKTGENPIQVFVKAIENSALREEVTSYQIGSITARKAVATAPQRRIDIALKFMVQGSYQKAFGKRSIVDTLSSEILNAYNASNESHAIREKERIEREAEGAR